VVILNLDDIVHDEPSPDVEIPVIDTFQDDPDNFKAQESDDEHHLVVLKLSDVGVEGVEQEDAVLAHDDEVEQELPDQSRDVLQRLGPGQQQWIHPDPIVNVDVGQPISN